MAPTGSTSTSLRRDGATGLDTDSRSASSPESALPPARPPERQPFELRFADVHEPGCEATLREGHVGEVLALACEHGARTRARAARCARLRGLSPRGAPRVGGGG